MSEVSTPRSATAGTRSPLSLSSGRPWKSRNPNRTRISPRRNFVSRPHFRHRACRGVGAPSQACMVGEELLRCEEIPQRGRKRDLRGSEHLVLFAGEETMGLRLEGTYLSVWIGSKKIASQQGTRGDNGIINLWWSLPQISLPGYPEARP